MKETANSLIAIGGVVMLISFMVGFIPSMSYFLYTIDESLYTGVANPLYVEIMVDKAVTLALISGFLVSIGVILDNCHASSFHRDGED